MQASSPLVSIVMPFRNTARFIPDCIASIRKQHHSNWELLAVNDHSEDSSEALMQEYARDDDRIQVHENPGRGIIPALRAAYRKSAGALITRMDSDDIMMPGRLSHMTHALMQHGRGHVAVGGVKYFSDRGISEGYQKYEAWLNALTARGSNYSELYKECVIPSPCWMVYREDFDQAGGFDPDRYPEDYDLTFRFYESGLQPISCTKILLRWRDYDARTSRNHEHYAQNYFLDIKMHYFLKLHLRMDRPLTVWGAGFKGKVIAKKLIHNQIAFKWLCDNPRKIGKRIYGIRLEHYASIDELDRPQCIISVANSDAQDEIRAYLSNRKMQPMQDYFFFC